MRYLVLVSHAAIAEGIRSAVEMLMGSHDELRTFCIDATESPEQFQTRLEVWLATLQPQDEAVLIGDIVGGSPVVLACEAFDRSELKGRYIALAGLNLPMAIAALMAGEEGLGFEETRDAIVASGVEAVCQV